MTLLGLRHPVTVASELASLDVLNEGRSFAAFGLGYRDEELKAFNLTKKQRFQRFAEGVEIIKRLWTEDHVSFSGEAFTLTDVTVDPKPLQKPRPPIWIAANTDAAVVRAARLGDGWMIGPHSAIDELERQVELCRTAWKGAGKEGVPETPIIRETFVAGDRKEAVEKARPCLEHLYRAVYIKWKQNEAMNDPNELAWAFDKLAKGRFILGSPSECIDQIQEYEERLGIYVYAAPVRLDAGLASKRDSRFNAAVRREGDPETLGAITKENVNEANYHLARSSALLARHGSISGARQRSSSACPRLTSLSCRST